MRVLGALKKLSLLDNIEYVIIGKPEKTIQQKFYKEIASYKSVKHFEYKDHDSIRRFLWDSDFMIMASDLEGFGLVYLESLACGVPVILPKNLPIVKEGICNKIILFSLMTVA